MTKKKNRRATPARPLMSHKMLVAFLFEECACNEAMEFIRKHRLGLDGKSWGKLRRTEKRVTYNRGWSSWFIELITALYLDPSWETISPWQVKHLAPAVGTQYDMPWSKARPIVTAFAKAYKAHLRAEKAKAATVPVRKAAARR